MLVDLQLLTILRDVRLFFPTLNGKILDVGCGQSPYRFLLNRSTTRYHGIDIEDAEKFDYSNPDVTPFNGRDIPFGNDKFDGLICTEVLEHVFDHAKLISEIHRVLKPGGRAIVTVPWSARYHYIPHDYFRYTPSALSILFGKFTQVTIRPRGNDLAVVTNKLIVIWARNVIPITWSKLLFMPLCLLAAPLLLIVVCLAHVALVVNFGSTDDPLGYTLVVQK
jgi:ubiquinone/menaquinone biosynthesis C-methylase UbiE